MIKFSTMWYDLNEAINKKKFDFNIDNEIESVLLIKEKEDMTLLTKDDFVDFWAKILLFQKAEIDFNDKKVYYISNLLKQLPYVKEEEGSIVLL